MGLKEMESGKWVRSGTNAELQIQIRSMGSIFFFILIFFFLVFFFLRCGSLGSR